MSINSSTSVLNRKAVFRGLNITITSHADVNGKIACDCHDDHSNIILEYGIIFEHSPFIHLTNLIIESCSLKFKLANDSNETRRTGILLLNATNLFIVKVHVIHCMGNGMTCKNLHGEIKIFNSVLILKETNPQVI